MADDSADLWAALPQRFSLEDLADTIRPLGIDLGDPEVRNEVCNLFETLRTDGFLCLEGEDNPLPNHVANNTAEHGTVTSVEVDFNDWLANRNILPSVFFELTYRCNQQCIHCFNPGAAHYPSEHPARETSELTTEEVCGLLDELALMGVYSVTLSGGEVSRRNDLLEILQETKRLGFSFNLFTNGQMSDKMVENICSLWPRTVGVSLYSAIPEIHDATTGVPGSFQRTLHTLRMLGNAGIRITVKCPLMRHTVNGYKRLLTLCDELNALPQIDLHISAGIDGNTACTIHQLLDEDVLSLVFRDSRIAMYVGLEVPNVGRQQKPIDGRVCGAGMYSLSVSPDGTVYPCNALPLPVGNIRSGGVKRIWQESAALRSWNSVVLSDFDECGLYNHCAYCNLCPGMAMSEFGNMFATHKTCCTTARVRMAVSKSLQNGIDPLQDRLLSRKGAFGYSDDIHLPAVTGVRTNPNPAKDARKAPIDDFVYRVEQIHKYGNERRKDIQPEVDSPAADRASVADLEEAGRFHEFGR